MYLVCVQCNAEMQSKQKGNSGLIRAGQDQTKPKQDRDRKNLQPETEFELLLEDQVGGVCSGLW